MSNENATAWLPIETAPKNGDPIRVRRRYSQYIEDREHVVYWDEDHGEGWWMVHDGKFDHPLRGDDPTEWQPIGTSDSTAKPVVRLPYLSWINAPDEMTPDESRAWAQGYEHAMSLFEERGFEVVHDE